MTTTNLPARARHTCGGPAFGRLTAGCPRCDELTAGAQPVRQAWRRRPTRAQEDAQRCREIEQHFTGQRHLSGGCGPVCTFGEW